MTVFLCALGLRPALGAEAPSIVFNGYGTAGIVHTNESQADFVANIFAPEGAGYSSDWSPEVDSRLGLQLTADFTPQLSAVAQVLIEQRYDGSYTPAVEWANLKYQFTPEVYVRLGRIVLPGLTTAEYRKVGYALPWVRPPLEVYGLQPVTNSDGVDVGYQMRLGEFTTTLRANAGRKDVKSANGGESRARNIRGLTGTLERGPLLLHVGYQRARVTVDSLQPLFDGFKQFGPQGAAIADRFDFDHKEVEMLGIGVRYDPGPWFLTGEWTGFQSRSILGDRDGGYLTAGYRIGSFTPYLTLARADTETPASPTGLSLAGLPPPLAAAAAGLNAALNQALSSTRIQRSLGAGVRWDFTDNAALKLQFDYTDMRDGSPGFLINEQPAFRPGGSLSVFSAAFDFVF